jgi:hypothetical protein
MPKNSPKRNNANQTRSKILSAALKLFNEKGFAGTSLSQISKLAQINQSLISHHFGNKENLFQIVKQSIVAINDRPQVNQTPSNLRSFLEEAIQQRLSLYEQSPGLYRLVAWEKLETPKTRKSLLKTLDLSIDPRQWLHPIKYLQEKELINNTYTPELILTWIMYSINAILMDDFGLFKKNSLDYKNYIELIESGLEKGLIP